MFIAVLGAAGQLGRDLVPRLSAIAADVRPLSRTDIDLAQPDTISTYFEHYQPTIFINCAAYNFVDQAETDPSAAYQTNAWGVRTLAELCAKHATKLVHFSTDYVYGLHQSDSPWREVDAPGPVSEYGRSKLAGEYGALAASTQHLVIRTCGLYGVYGSGGKGGNFVETMLRLAQQGKQLRVVADQHCTPTATADLAAATLGLIQQNASGLFHATNAGATTWHDLAAAVFKFSDIPSQLTPITSAEFGAPARRPSYSVLDCRKLESAGVPPLPPWETALANYLQSRASLRKQEIAPI